MRIIVEPMTSRNILYVLTLIAYTLSLAHSVIPHHHHDSVEEATAHHHSDDHHHNTADHHHNTGHQHGTKEQHSHADDDHSNDQSHKGETGHFFFFSHDLNADVLARHGSIDNPVKVKKAHHIAPLQEQIISFEVTKYLVFHPPQDDPSFYSAFLHQFKLRGPPTLIA